MTTVHRFDVSAPQVDPTKAMSPAEIATRMSGKNPFTHQEISARMSEIGMVLASCRFAPHVNAKALEEEWDYLKSIYDRVLTGAYKP
ncbi:MAG: hypothetical protein H0T48_12560 [Gemmatimonadaceae bacterium]|nr:hypothetical protein [Gemmatimonadaceae bacterium]